MYRLFFKRFLDFTLSLIAIIILSPIYIIVAILIRIKLGSPVIFCQERPGKDEKVFKMYKFRTMTDAKDENGNLLPDDIRLTSFGKKIRATSLDELPELKEMKEDFDQDDIFNTKYTESMEEGEQ